MFALTVECEEVAVLISVCLTCATGNRLGRCILAFPKKVILLVVNSTGNLHPVLETQLDYIILLSAIIVVTW